jgi:hypothetical protein
VIPLGIQDWDPAESDSVVFQLDSVTTAIWADSAEALRGMRLEALSDGVRLDVVGIGFQLDTRPSINQDTVVSLPVTARRRTFIYRPGLSAPSNEIWVGGVPAWRTVFALDLPETVPGPPEVCGSFGVSCPIPLTSESLVSGALVLRTKAPHPAFQPTDSLFMDVRPVLEPSRMPKSPLGSSVVSQFGLGVLLTPEIFGDEDDVEVSIPIGSYLSALIQAESGVDIEVPRNLALLSSDEPLSLYLASFSGPGSPAEPVLRLVLTIAGDVGIR